MTEQGFSVADRDTLTTVKVQLGFLVSSVQDALSRIKALEETRLTARDLEELMSDTDTLRAEKKETDKSFSAQYAAMSERIGVLEQWHWRMGGAAMAAGAIAGLAARILLK